MAIDSRAPGFKQTATTSHANFVIKRVIRLIIAEQDRACAIHVMSKGTSVGIVTSNNKVINRTKVKRIIMRVLQTPTLKNDNR